MNSIYRDADTRPLEDCITQGLTDSNATISKLFGGPVIVAITDRSFYTSQQLEGFQDYVSQPSHLIRNRSPEIRFPA